MRICTCLLTIAFILGRLMAEAFSSRANSSTRSFASSTMQNLLELDSLTVKVIVDNESDAMTTGLSNLDGFEYLSEKQSQKLAGTLDQGMCNAGHGFSLLLQGKHGDEEHSLLFDAGPDPVLWKMNSSKLGIDTSQIEAVVLSHYHWDHSGGLRGAVPVIAETSSDPSKLLVDLHSSAIVSRGRPSPDGGVVPHSPTNPTAEELAEYGVSVELHDQAHTVCNDFFYVSGHISRVVDYERGIPNHATLIGGKWVPDEEIADERYVACLVQDLGVVVFSACSHAGINNVCRDVRHRIPDKALFGVIGGFHLGGAAVEDRIEQTVKDLQTHHPSVVLAGHCTGWRAKAHLAREMPDQFQPLAVGATYTFRAS